MEHLPTDVLRWIFARVDQPSKFNAALTCRRWFYLLHSDLPQLFHLHISLDSLACDAFILYRTARDTSAAICQCTEHTGKNETFLQEVLHSFGSQLSSIAVEDYLLNKTNDEVVRDNSLHMILSECDSLTLRQLALHFVDLSSVRVWTLSIFAKFSSLTSISFEACKFPAELNESLFLRMLATSFGALESFCITSNELITDKLCMTMAKKCTRLRELTLRGCSQITALSVVAFCEHLAYAEESIPITMDLRETSFNAMELSRHLHSPLLRGGPCWRAQSITVNIGFDRQALILTNMQRNDSFIMVYV